MYKITTSQQSLMDKILCGVLPNDTFDAKIATDILNELNSFIKEDELYGIYYIFWKMISNIKLIELYRNKHSISLTRETFESAISVSLTELIVQPEFEAQMYFTDNGVSYDLTVPLQVEEASNFTYSALMDKYDEIFSLGISPDESLATIPILKDDIKQGLSAMMISLQGQCITNGVKYGYKTYRGYDDWTELLNKIQSEISRRFISEVAEERHKLVAVDSYSDSLEFDNKYRNRIRPLFYIGFEPSDSLGPIKTEDIITIVADEGTGKTKLAIYAMYQAIMAGNNVLFCCGETASIKIKRGLEALHIWRMYKKQFTYNEIDCPDAIEIEVDDMVEQMNSRAELAQTVRSAQVDLYDNSNYGKVAFVQNLVYETIEKTLTDYHKDFNFDICFIDHVGALDKDGSYVAGEKLSDRNKRITHLFESEDRLVKKLNIAFWNTSHTDRDTASANVRGKEVGVRISADSSSVTKYSSIIIHLLQNEDAKKNSQIILQYKKTRDTEAYTHPLVINRLGLVNDHEYLPEMQYMANGGEDNTSFEDMIDM